MKSMKMKKRTLVTVLICLTAMLTTGGVVYAAWLSNASNTNNTVKIGDEVVLSLNDNNGSTKYFDVSDAALGQGNETNPTTITVTSSKASQSYGLWIRDFVIKDGDTTVTPDYSENELYIKISTDVEPNWANITGVKFADGVQLLAPSAGTSRTVSIVIGVPDDAPATLAGYTISFSISTIAS